MVSNNYYKRLGVHPQASAQEIKRAYRRMAIKYHPDKNPGDVFAESAFKEIVEAYDILSDPRMREDYHRKYFRSQDFTHQTTPAATPRSILQDAIQLQKMVAKSDPFRLNQDALFFKVDQILSEDNLMLLLDERQNSINRQLIDALLQICKPLNLSFIEMIEVRLILLSDGNTHLENDINKFINLQKRSDRWARYKIPLAILIAIVLCLVMFFVNR